MASSKSKWRVLVIIVAVVAVALAGFFLLRRPKRLRYRTTTVAKGEILSQVSATGTVNPVNEVVVGSQVSGILDTVLVDYNDFVKVGQVLARIDPRNYQSALLQAGANLTSARVSLEQSQRDYYHAETLYQAKLISGDQWVQTKTTYDLAQTKVTQAQANYEQAQTNLAYTTIRAPMSGLVIARKVQGGQTVAASFSAPELFHIADLSKMQVEVSVQEADVGKLDTGMQATFKVDAYPDRTFEGKLVQIRNDPIVSQNVVTYIGIVHVANPDFVLKPGMTADVKIEVTHVQNVLVVPSSALNPKMGSLLGLAQSRNAPGGRSGSNQGAASGPAGGQMRPEGSPPAQPSGAAVGQPSGLPRAAEGELAHPLAVPTKPGPKTQTLYALEKGVPAPRQVEVGVNDSYNTQIKSGLKEGEIVILGLDQARVNPFQQQGRPPMGGFH